MNDPCVDYSTIDSSWMSHTKPKKNQNIRFCFFKGHSLDPVGWWYAHMYLLKYSCTDWYTTYWPCIVAWAGWSFGMIFTIT